MIIAGHQQAKLCHVTFDGTKVTKNSVCSGKPISLNALSFSSKIFKACLFVLEYPQGLITIW